MKKLMLLALLTTSTFMSNQLYSMAPTSMDEIQKMLTQEGGALQAAFYNLVQATLDLLPDLAESTEEGGAEESTEEQTEATTAPLTTATVGEFVGGLNKVRRAGQGFIQAIENAKKVAKRVKGETWQQELSEQPAETSDSEAIDDEDLVVVTQPEEPASIEEEEGLFTIIGIEEPSEATETE